MIQNGSSVIIYSSVCNWQNDWQSSQHISSDVYVSKAFLPCGRRPHVKQLCARTCPVLPVQRKLCKNISSSDRYHFVQKHPQEYYKKRQHWCFSNLCVKKGALLHFYWHAESRWSFLVQSVLALTILLFYQSQAPFHAFTKLLLKNLHPPISEKLPLCIANRNVTSLRQ